jgi:hypothetical protein
MEKPKADARKKSGDNQHMEPSGKVPEGSKGQTRDKVGEALGLSGRQYAKVKAVMENAVPELVGQVDAGEVSAGCN